jgi:hypothetical protein
VLVSTLTVGIVYGIAGRAGGLRAGRIAAMLCAFFPTLIAYSHYIYSETLFAALLAGAVWLLHRSPGGAGRGGLVGAGVLFGLACLTRAAVLYFFPVWMAWLALGRRWDELRRAALVFGVVLATILPWTIRNAVIFHDFIPIDATVGRTAWWAYNEKPAHVDLGYVQNAAWYNRKKCSDVVHPLRRPLPGVRELRALFPPDAELEPRLAKRMRFELHIVRRYGTLDLVAYQRCEVRAALRFIRENPGLAARRIAERLYTFWGPNSFLLRSVYWKSYPGGILARGHYEKVKLVVVSSYVAVVLLAMLALGRRDPPPLVEWLALLFVYYTGVHALAVASTRYRFSIMPLVIVLAALWLARPCLPQTRARRWAVGVTAVAFAALCVDYLRSVLP